MSIKQWPGGVISDNPVVPTGPNLDDTAPGVWTLDRVAYWRAQNLWPTAGYIKNAWDLDYMQFYTPAANAFDVTTGATPYAFGSNLTDTPSGSFFTEDGLTLFLSYNADDTVRKYTLSKAWDVTTLSQVASFSVLNETNALNGLSFKPDGTKMYIISNTTNNVGIYEYNLSTAWDITTAVVVVFRTVQPQVSNPNSVNFKTDGTKMFVSNTGVVYEYNLSTAWDIDTATFGQSKTTTTLTSPSETLAQSTIFSPDGTKLYLTGLTNYRIHQLSLSLAWDVSTLALDGLFNPSDASSGPVGALAVSSDGLKFFRYRGTAFVQYPLSPTLNVVSQDASPTGLFFKPDGTKLYVVGLTNDNVYEYDLSTAWNVSTASYVQSFSVATYETTPRDLSFSSDGTSMYVIGTLADNVTQYSLSTAWDISTASYVQQFYVGSQEPNPYGLDFSPDGTKMFIVGVTNDNVYRYNLSTPWDISTASYVQYVSVSGQDTNPFGLAFETDGTKMYILGGTNDKIYQYDLSTAWDLTTASYVTSQLTYTWNSSLTGNPFGLYFRSDGGLFFIVDLSSRTVFSYNFSKA